MTRKYLSLALTALILVVTLLPGSSLLLAGTNKQSDRLIFAGNKELAPLIFTQGEKPAGLVVDIVRAVAQHAGLDIEILARNWDEAQRLMRAGKIDALLQINPSSDREQLYDFSEPLLMSEFAIFRKSQRVAIQNIHSLSGLVVGVEKKGYPRTLLHNYPEVVMQTIPGWQQGFQAIKDGDIDALVVDRWVGKYQLFLSGVQGISDAPEPVDVQFSSIAVTKGNDELLDKINLGLRLIAQDGTRKSIEEKWSGKEIVTLSKETLHLYWVIGIVSAIASIASFFVLIFANRVKKINKTLLKREKSLASEIEKRKEIEKKLRIANHALHNLSEIDSLTGLWNRRKYENELKKQILSTRKSETDLCLLVADIDYFKAYNDHYGHEQGDNALRAIAKIIKRSLKRNTDTVFRYGGEEFVVLLPYTDEDGGYNIANNIINNICQSNIEHNYSKIGNKLTVSIGVASIHSTSSTKDMSLLFKNADDALYHAKNNGKNHAQRHTFLPK
ncbi:transporter substrate-binding domain-containing diguanylate cyclase [Desulfoplanes formicivorans]|nr:GGDEF domain-containing protein [Desulfoplanes formicivorans]